MHFIFSMEDDVYLKVERYIRVNFIEFFRKKQKIPKKKYLKK